MIGYKKPGPYPYVLCLIFVLFQGNMLYSQHYGAFGASEAKLPLVVQPSPNSASLARMTTDNVNLYTGRLSVAVPIYTLKSRDLEVPISLQGNASGHKVNEYASWAGLGWSLNAGGSITRVMNNLPDEFTGTIESSSFNFPGYGYTKLKSLKNVNVGLLEGPTYDFNRKKEIIDKGNWNVSSDKPSEGYDLQPDEFYFNFGKYSGKFVFDQDGKIYTVPRSNLVITPGYEVRDGNNKITSFTATTEEGVQYQFGNYSLNAVEETKVSLKTDFARFYFEAVKNGDNYVMSNGKYVYYKEPRVATMMPPDVTVALDFFGRNEETTDFFYYPSTWHLTKITSPTGDNITLNYADNGILTYMSDRSFSGSMPNLDDADVAANGLYGPQYVSPIAPVHEAWWFFEHYPSPQLFSVVYTNISLRSKRLVSIVTDANDRVNFEANTMREDLPGDRRLDKIVVVNRSNNVLKEFKLDYDVSYGHDQGEDEIEEFTFRFYGVKRYYKSGGGFDFHDYSQLYNEVQYFPIPEYCRKRMFLKTVQESGGGISLPPWKFEYNTTLLPFRGSNAQDYFGYATVNTNMHPFPDLSYKFTLNGEPETVPYPGSYPLFSFKVTNFVSPPPIIGANANKSYDLQRMKAGVITKITYPTGGYKTFEYEFNGEAKAWNGLRVSSIKEYESATASPNIKNYTYGTFNKTDEYLTKHQMHERAHGQYFDDRVFWSSRKVNPDNGQGSAGGYDYVEIKQPGHGRYRVEFSNTSHLGYEDRKNFVHGLSTLLTPNELALTTDISPFPAPTSFDYRRGLPLEEYTYDENNKLLKRTSYVYDYSSVNVNDKVIPGAMVTKFRFNYSKGARDWFLFGKYDYYVQWMALATKIDKTYAADGDITHYAETREDYTQVQPILNSQEFMFPKTIKTKKPGKNEELITQNSYGWEFPTTSPYDDFDLGLLRLTASNAPAKVVEQLQYLQNPDGSNKRIVAGTINKYNSDKPLVKQAYSLKLATPLNFNAFAGTSQVNGSYTFDPHFTTAARFDYGAKGNVVQQQEGDNIKLTYIWNDNHTYPIAKVINAGTSDCAYTSWEEGALTGNWTQTNLYFDEDGNALTGKRGGNAGWSSLTKTGLDPAKTYVVSFWTYNNTSVSVNGTSVFAQPGPGLLGWKYRETSVSGVSQVVVNGAFGIIDEIRLFPKNAQMITYIADPLIGVTSETDPNFRIKLYEFDGLQRLKLIRDEKKNILKTFDYNYKDDNTAPMWAGTNEKRCVPCPQNSNYHTAVQEIKQVDVNPNSPTYKSERWYSLGYTGACTVQADWQNISGPTCLVNGNGFNTGVQRIVQKDMNPCSGTYNQTKNIDATDYTLCPSNEPNFQPLNDYRCQLCPANTSYTSKIQERKWQDMNPYSATSGNIDWRATGAQCANSPVWQNTATAPRCMLNEMNLPYGYQEREKRDVNPCSDTYNQVLWMEDGTSSSCRKVYVFVDMEDYRSLTTTFGTTCDVWVRFYYDMNRSQPAIVTNAKITIVENRMNSCDSYEVDVVFNNVSGQAVKLYEDVLFEFDTPEGCYNSWNYTSKYW